MSIFRKSALDALSSPEKLDEPLRLMRQTHWILLFSIGGFCLTIVAWAIFGRLPIRISGRGVLVRQNSLQQIQSETTGRLIDLWANVGDCVEAGNKLARVEPVQEQLDEQQAQIKLKQLKELDRKEDLIGETRIKQLRSSITRVSILAKTGAFPIDELEQRMQKLTDLEDSLAARNNQREQEITQQKTNINSLNATMQRTAIIKAPVAGCVVDSSTHLNEVVQPGARLFTLETTKPYSKLESLGFFPAKDGKRLAVGQRVRISPASTKPQRHGGISGMIKAISPLPVRETALRKRLGHESLVNAVLDQKKGPLIEIVTSLQRDPNTESGFNWGGGPGPHLKLSSGTPTTVRVLVEERRPISYVLPILRDLTGIY